MGSKGGKLPSAGQPQVARQLRLTQSSMGQAIALVYGEQRIASNILFAMYFTAIQHDKSVGGGGKAGALGSGLVTRTYSVSALLALCEGALDASDPDFADVPVALLQQVLAIGRASPGRQVMTISDKTGAKSNPQPEAGWAPAVWKDKKLRRLVNDQKKAVIGNPDDPDGEEDTDGDDKDDIREFRPCRFHDFGETPDTDTVPDASHFITGPNDLIRGAFKNAKSSNGNRVNPQRDAYITQANENYFGIACVARQDMRLGSNASMPNWNFPVRGLMQYRDIYGLAVGDLEIFDADPACVLFDVLTNPKHGAGWDRAQFQAMLQGYPTPWGAMDATPPADSWSAYCRALGILLSPFYDSQRAAADIVSDLAEATNSAPVWSEATLKMIPYGDREVTSAQTGVTFTPSDDAEATTDGANLAVRYALTLDDFLPGKNKDFVHVQRRAVVPDVRGDYKSEGLFNHVRVEFLNGRQNGANPPNGYAVEIAEAKDAASIAAHGVLSREPYQRHDITSAAVAQAMAERQLKRLVSVRNVYTFTLGWQFILIEPMDVLSFPGEAISPAMAGQVIVVRVTTVSEDKDGALEFEAEDFPRDVAAATIPEQPDNPTIVPEGSISFAPIFSPSPVDGIYPGSSSPAAALPIGAVPGTVYQAINATALQAVAFPEEVGTPLPVEVTFDALAIRAYQALRYADDAVPLRFRFRYFETRPPLNPFPNGTLQQSHGEIEVVIDASEVQWRDDGIEALRQSTSCSRVATGSFTAPAGAVVCIECACINTLGQPITDSSGVAPGAVSFTACSSAEAGVA